MTDQHIIQTIAHTIHVSEKQIQTALTLLQSGNTRVTKESDDSYYILYRAEAPSVMVECGFMSNYAENNHLKDPRYQRLLACVIGVGILEWGVQIGEK